jgi:serine/threonine protein kinase
MREQSQNMPNVPIVSNKVPKWKANKPSLNFKPIQPPSVSAPKIDPSDSTDDNKYTLEEAIGEGSFKTVYIGKCKDTENCNSFEELAIYKIKNHGGEDIERFEIDREIFMYNKIKEFQNKNNCRPDDALLCVLDVNKKSRYIVTNHLKGYKSLETFMSASQLTVGNIIYIMRQLLQAINIMHSQLHLIHHDIKPANIMIEPSTMHVVLIDYGVSCIIDQYKQESDDPTYACSRAEKATPNYALPDLPTFGGVDETYDIFALGLVFYELVHKTPFFAENPTNEAFDKKMDALDAHIDSLEGCKKQLLKVIRFVLMYHKNYESKVISTVQDRLDDLQCRDSTDRF